MDDKEILGRLDHTLLSPVATWDQARALCLEAIEFGTASVCLAPNLVEPAADWTGGRIPICTVIGFPTGAHTLRAKMDEAEEALCHGASELDMVISLTAVKMGRYDLVGEEIRELKALCGDRILKVIVETCLLEQEEKIRLCRLVAESGADFIKTSTGFSHGGATREDIELFARHRGPLRIKAAGGITRWEDARDFVALGADRLGSSRLIGLFRQRMGEAVESLRGY